MASGGKACFVLVWPSFTRKWTGKKQQERQGRGEAVAVTNSVWQSIRQCMDLASRSSYTREASGEGGGK